MKLIYKLLDFFRGNKRKKPIKTTVPTANTGTLTIREELANKNYLRNIRKEREIGVHPKYRNHRSRYTEQDVEDWEALEQEWEKKNV